MVDRKPLPVDASIAPLLDLLRSERAAVVIAPPGSGKTTRIPPALVALGRTILLQPRRVAARALARRIAFERHWTLGEEIGWQIRFERRFSARTQLLVATEGILTARLQSDPLLSDFSVVVLDEFHERSIHADLALALVKQAALSRDDLTVVVMSATMDATAVSRFLGGAPVVNVDARTFPIDVRYSAGTSMSSAVHEVVRKADGHVLCFLPGAREIERTRTELADLTDADVLPLHGSLEVDAQERALAPSPRRKVILATNVAETSLTVEGVTDVIDSGLHKVLRYDAETSVDHLELEQISLDSADQRAGRAGRTQPGRATRLWDERMMLRPHREPEVRRIDLASAALDILAWGGDPATFEWFDPPPAERIESALSLLRLLGAIEGRKLTPIGELLRRFPLHPRLARVLVAAGGAEEAVRICAELSDSDVGELRGITKRVLQPLTWPSGPVLSRKRERMPAAPLPLRGRGQPPQAAGEGLPLAALSPTLRAALLAGYPDRVAMRREPGSSRLLLMTGTGAQLARELNFREGEFVVALDIAGSGTGEPIVRMATAVEREWLVPTHRERVHTIVNGKVRATERTWYGAILLHEQGVTPDAEEASRLLAQSLRESLDPDLQRRIAFAQLDVDWDSVLEHAAAAKSHDVEQFLPWNVKRSLNDLAPERIDLPSGRTAKLEYREDGSVVASAKLQELFGLAESPRLGPQRTPVTFSLLSPSGRPVQITKDLKSFWTTGYQDVRKELRGRYPKHPWPEDPWTAQATHRTKKRSN